MGRRQPAPKWRLAPQAVSFRWQQLTLYKEDLLEGKDTYDQWGQNLVLDSNAESFYSKGPDRVANSSDDVT